MAPRYRVTLAEEERQEMEALTRAATKTTGKRFLYARALLLCDRGPRGPGWSVARAAEALGVATRTIERLKQRFVEQGLEAALERKRRVRPPREVIFDGAFEARLVALACSQAVCREPDSSEVFLERFARSVQAERPPNSLRGEPPKRQ